MYGNGRRKDRRQNGGVPPRWLRCPRKSTGFLADKFLVFKTPLSSQYDEHVPSDSRFHPSMVQSYMKSVRRKIGLWIDLTNTDRYYHKEEIESAGICFMKMNCEGANGPPSEEQIELFRKICNNFSNKNPNDIIGVHCTHGFNRSGFLICAYLVHEFDWGIQVAISEFAKLRPPGIYKQDYLNRLFEIFDPEGSPPPKPELPDWCFEDEEVVDDDGFMSNRSSSSTGGSNSYNNQGGNKRSHQNGDGGSQSNGVRNKRRREFVKDNPVFMEGVPGVEPVTDTEEHTRVQRKVQEMCGWESAGFPGSQPISMDVRNIGLIAEHPYMVSWKADGTRYLMLIEDRNQVFFIDRDNCVFRVSGMTFPYRKILGQHITETLVDGEMVLDKIGDKTFPRYLIYDIIKFRGEEVGKTEFRTRLLCIEKELVNERYRAIENGEIDRESEPFGVRFKQFWYLDKTEQILRGALTKQLPHEPDGAVFQPIKEPYICGRCDYVLKWKPPHLNTIDFRLKVVTQTGEGLLPTKMGHLYVGQLNQPFGMLKKVTRDVAKLDGKIIECRFDGTGWIFLRERTDKSFPNAFKTAEAVWASIRQPVTMEFLLDFIRNRQYRKP